MKNKLVLIVAVILFIVPFFWLRPGEMDLGGDTTRLYFYDPLSYLRNNNLYAITFTGKNSVEAYFYSIPLVLIIFMLKQIISSPFLLITIFNSIKLTVGFLAVYAIIKEILGENKISNKLIANISAIIGGFFYILSPLMANGQWDRALESHSQFFLNPLIFYLCKR